MNKFFCFLTGGHRYLGEPGIVVDDNKNKTMTFYMNCEKCGQTRRDTFTYRQLGFPSFMCEEAANAGYEQSGIERTGAPSVFACGESTSLPEGGKKGGVE